MANTTNTTNTENTANEITNNTVQNKTTTTTNPKTGDIITISVILLITATVGVIITNRMKMTNGK